MESESLELEHKVRELEQQIAELQKQYNILKSGYSILIESYARIEEHLSKLSRSLELSVTPLISPLHLIELQNRKESKPKSHLEELIDKTVDSIFEDYKQQFRGEQ